MGLQTIALLAVLAALMCAVLARALRPLLVRYALARPNARSSHRTPTPQGGGIAVMVAAILALAIAAVLMPELFEDTWNLALVFAAAVGVAVIGAIDDIRPIQPIPRLVLQAAAAALVIAALPAELRAVPMLPWWVERALLLVGLLWLVNLVNFMDGIDWITVAEIVPVTAALAVFGWNGALPVEATLTAAVLCGAMLGFAPFNRPVAQLFLGDVGSLPIGLVMGWLLILLAEHHFVAAALLPLYYVADATITLLRRFLRGERITQPHRHHFYQQAIDGGRGIYAIVGSIVALNVLLAALAAATILDSALAMQIVCAIVGAAAVAAELVWLARVPSKA